MDYLRSFNNAVYNRFTSTSSPSVTKLKRKKKKKLLTLGNDYLRFVRTTAQVGSKGNSNRQYSESDQSSPRSEVVPEPSPQDRFKIPQTKYFAFIMKDGERYAVEPQDSTVGSNKKKFAGYLRDKYGLRTNPDNIPVYDQKKQATVWTTTNSAGYSANIFSNAGGEIILSEEDQLVRKLKNELVEERKKSEDMILKTTHKEREYQANITQLQDQITNLKTEMHSLNDRKNITTVLNQTLKTEINDLTQQLNKLISTKQSHPEDVKHIIDLKRQIDALNSENLETKGGFATAKKKIIELESIALKLNNTIIEKEKQIESHKKQLNEFEDSNIRLKTDLKKLNDQYRQVQADFISIDGKRKIKESEVETLNVRIEGLLETISRMEKEKSLDEKAKNDLKILEEKLEGLSQLDLTQKSELMLARKANSDLQKNIEAISKELSNEINKNKTLVSHLQTIEKKHQELIALRSQPASAENKAAIADKEMELNFYRDRVNKVETANIELNDIVTELSKKAQVDSEQIAQLSNQLTTTQQENYSLTQQYRNEALRHIAEREEIIKQLREQTEKTNTIFKATNRTIEDKNNVITQMAKEIGRLNKKLVAEDKAHKTTLKDLKDKATDLSKGKNKTTMSSEIQEELKNVKMDIEKDWSKTGENIKSSNDLQAQLKSIKKITEPKALEQATSKMLESTSSLAESQVFMRRGYEESFVIERPIPNINEFKFNSSVYHSQAADSVYMTPPEEEEKVPEKKTTPPSIKQVFPAKEKIISSKVNPVLIQNKRKQSGDEDLLPSYRASRTRDIRRSSIIRGEKSEQRLPDSVLPSFRASKPIDTRTASIIQGKRSEQKLPESVVDKKRVPALQFYAGRGKGKSHRFRNLEEALQLYLTPTELKKNPTLQEKVTVFGMKLRKQLENFSDAEKARRLGTTTGKVKPEDIPKEIDRWVQDYRNNIHRIYKYIPENEKAIFKANSHVGEILNDKRNIGEKAKYPHNKVNTLPRGTLMGKNMKSDELVDVDMNLEPDPDKDSPWVSEDEI